MKDYNDLSSNNIKASEEGTVSGKEVALKLVRDIIFILAGGAFYYLLVSRTPFGLKCIFYEVLSLKCPVCGTTRMAKSIIQLDFIKAFSYNQFIFISLPYIIFEIIYLLYLMESQKTMGRINKWSMIIWAALLIIFGIVRNIWL